MMNDKILYVAYGSNINTEQMGLRCPGAKVHAIGKVQGYQLEFNKVATLVRDDTAEAPCVVWEISKKHEASLDRYEGYPYKYGKKLVSVQTDQGEFKAMAYIMNDSRHIDVPKDEYYGRILDGYTTFDLDINALEAAYERSIKAAEKRYSSIRESHHSYSGITYDEIEQARVEGFRAAMDYATYIGLCTEDELYDIRDSDIRGIIGSFLPRNESRTLHKQQSNDNEYTYYIAYGSNLNVEHMKQRCPKSSVYAISTLPDYELVFDGCATVEPKKGAKTPVMVWKIHNDDWQALDRYEGYPSYYRKEYLPVKYKGEVLDTVIYIMNRDRNTYRPPSSGYLDVVKKGYNDAKMDLSYLNAAAKKSIDWWNSRQGVSQNRTPDQVRRR